MPKLSRWLIRASRGWVVLAALVLFILFMVLVMPGQTKRAQAASSGAGTPDLSMVYSAADLYRMAEAYGAQGRQEYIHIRFTFDLAWPLVYTLFLVTATSWVLARAFPPTSPWRLANLVPLLGMFLDLLENISTSVVMLRYPAPAPAAAFLAPLFTFTKWSVLGLAFLMLLFGVLRAILSKKQHG